MKLCAKGTKIQGEVATHDKTMRDPLNSERTRRAGEHQKIVALRNLTHHFQWCKNGCTR